MDSNNKARGNSIRNENLGTFGGFFAPLLYGVRVGPVLSECPITTHNLQAVWGGRKSHILTARIRVCDDDTGKVEHISAYSKNTDFSVLVAPLKEHGITTTDVEIRVFVKAAPTWNAYCCTSILHFLHGD